MVRCRLCLTFEHEEGAVSCAGCRSIRRIRDLYCGGFLVRSQESRGLEILRSCVGALTDLAEEAAPILEKERQESGPSEAATAPKTAGPLGEPLAPVVGRLLESEKEAVEFVKTEEDEKKGEQAPPGVGELQPEGVEGVVKAEGEETDKPKKKRKRKHISRGPEQKDRRRRRREKKAAKEKSPAPKEEAVEAAPEEEAGVEPPSELPAEVPPPPPEVPERRGPLGLVPAPKGTVSKHCQNHHPRLGDPGHQAIPHQAIIAATLEADEDHLRGRDRIRRQAPLRKGDEARKESSIVNEEFNVDLQVGISNGPKSQSRRESCSQGKSKRSEVEAGSYRGVEEACSWARGRSSWSSGALEGGRRGCSPRDRSRGHGDRVLHRLHRRLILRSQDEGCWHFEVSGRGAGSNSLPAQRDRDDIRGPAQIPERETRDHYQGSPLPERVHGRTHSGGLGAWPEDAASFKARSRGRLDAKSRSSRPSRSRLGRACRIACSGRRIGSCSRRSSRRWRKKDRRGRGQTSEPQSKEGKEEREKEEQRKEPEEEKEGEASQSEPKGERGQGREGQEQQEEEVELYLQQQIRQAGWEAAAPGIYEGLRCPVRGDRAGQERKGPSKSSSLCQKSCKTQDQGQDELRERKLLVEGDQRLWRGSGGHALRRGNEDTTGSPTGSWCVGMASPYKDAWKIVGRSGSRTDGWLLGSSGDALHEAAPPEAGHRPGRPGALDACNGRRHDVEGKALQGPRRFTPEDESGRSGPHGGVTGQ